MRRPEGGGWRCSYGTWHGIDEHCRCAGSAVTPSDLPWVECPGTTVRFHIGSDLAAEKRAEMTHPAETVVRRPHFVKEVSA